jgi:flagellar basal body L-ring protein FlgH
MQYLSSITQTASKCLGAMIVASLFATGCVSHIKPYKPKRRQYELPVAQPAAQAQSSGSIFDSNSIAIRLMTDPRAQQINDLVIIKIDERVSA